MPAPFNFAGKHRLAMTFNDEYSDKRFLFSGNTSELKLKEIADTSPVTFTLSVSSQQPGSTKPPAVILENSFSLSPYNKTIVLNLKEILEGLGSILIPGAFGEFKNVEIIATSGDNTARWAHYVIQGKCDVNDSKRLTEDRIWWTGKPQVTVTYKHGFEKLEYYSDWEAESVVWARVYFRIHHPFKVILGRTVGSHIRLFTIDCSYTTIRRQMDAVGIKDEIVAYDIYIEGLEEQTQRVIVKEDNAIKEFRFRNHLGVFDYIYASGELVMMHESDIRTFVNSGIETELANDGKRSFESDTGYIDSNEKAAMWLDFFASAEHYVLGDNREWKMVVIDSVGNEIKQGELGSMSFKWHYAEKVPDSLSVRHKLKPHIHNSYGISEL